MKKWLVCAVLVLSAGGMFGGLSWCGNSFIVINGTWYTGSNEYVQPAGYFNGNTLGELTSLSLGGELQSWDEDQDKTGQSARLHYNIDGGTNAFVNLPWLKKEGNNEFWQNMGAVINISGLSSGEHTLTIWFEAIDTQAEPDVSQWDSRDGANYVATFTTPDGQVPITLASFAAEAGQGVVTVTWVTESEIENDHFVLRRNGEILAMIAGAGTTTEPHAYVYTDRRVEAGRVYRYALSDVSYGGVETLHDPITVEIPAGSAAESFVLEAAYPNPFNPQTSIRYRLTADSHLDLAVYDTRGMRVATLFSGERESGSYESVWHAGDMPSGIYLIRMTAGERTLTQKTVLMK